MSSVIDLSKLITLSIPDLPLGRMQYILCIVRRQRDDAFIQILSHVLGGPEGIESLGDPGTLTATLPQTKDPVLFSSIHSRFFWGTKRILLDRYVGHSSHFPRTGAEFETYAIKGLED